MKAQIGQKAPLLLLSDWVQGEPCVLDQLSGRVVLVEVFQVNCPGCFLYALPQAVDLYQRYSDHGLSVLGVATAFEDFDKNNLENLTHLIENGEVVGETHRTLSQQGKLLAGRLPFRIPFPVAMDRLQKRQADVTQDEIETFINQRIPNFYQQTETYQQKIRQQVQHYFQSLTYHAETFELFDLKGTPSHILVDKKGLLRDCAFGAHPDLEARVLELLRE
jgi:thiol-disulfide isomerase/thioredoxin